MNKVNEIISFITSNALALVLLAIPLLIPLITKKWKCFFTVVTGYLLYIILGIDLYFTADITEYGTAYGIFMLPYLIGIIWVGTKIQRKYS